MDVSKRDAPYQVLPPLAADDYERLRSSIAQRGVEVAIVVDEDGVILDGHHRSQIATELGIDCPRLVKTGLADHEKRLFSVTLNLARRQLTDAQKVLLGRQIEPDVAERARRRQAHGATAPGRPADAGGQMTTSVDRGDKTRDEVARTVGLGSGRTYERAKEMIEAVEEHAPELMPQVEAGAVDLPQIRKEIKRRVPSNPIRREFLAVAQDAVENATQESIDSWVEMSIEAQALPVTAELLGTAVVALHRASLNVREIRPELLRELATKEPNERERIERAIDMQTDMIARFREALGKQSSKLRRVI